MKRNDAEFRLQAAVVQHLHLSACAGVFFCAIPNGEHRSPRTGARLKAMGVRPGAPDILLIIDGIAHGLELKIIGGRQSDTQRATEASWKASGGIYRVTHGINETLAQLVAWGALPDEFAARRPKPIRLPLDDLPARSSPQQEAAA